MNQVKDASTSAARSIKLEFMLLVTQWSQNDEFSYLNLGSNFRSEIIFKPYFDMWLSLRCHIIIDSSSFDVTHQLLIVFSLQV